MAQIAKKLIKLGTNSGELNGADLDANFSSPTNYTPDGSNPDISSHLKGIDSTLGTVANPNDIGETSFSLANNQSVAADVTGLSFSNAAVRSAEVHYSIVIDATADLFETGTIFVIQKGSSWDIARDFNGDDSLIDFTINTSGQVQYTSSSYAGFSSGTMKFRAITTGV